MDPKDTKRSSSSQSGDLTQFLKSLTDFSVKIEKGMLAQSDDEDATNVITAYSSVFRAQLTELCAYVQQRASKASRQANSEVATVLKLTSGNLLVQRGLDISQDLGSQTAKISISGIFELIKKILKAILDIFGITLPKWLDKLLELLDEILNFLLSAGLPRLANILSRQHQDYLSEQTQLARLERESAWRYESHDDEE
jgi:hypothetical protein